MRNILILLTGVALLACNQEEPMEKKIENAINELIEKQPAEIAVALQTKDFYVGINDTVVMHAASTMKVPVMIEIFRQIEAGKFALQDSLVVRNEFKSIIDGSPYQMDINEDSGDRFYALIGQKASIENLVFDMITFSGNLTTNILIDFVGAQNVQNTVQNLGVRDLLVLRGVEDIKAFRAGKNNTTTARALTDLFQAILTGQAANQPSTAKMIEILLAQSFRDKIPATLPEDAKVAHKTGSITAISHDAGIIYPPDHDPYVLTVLTRDFEDPEAAKACIADISAMVYRMVVEREME